MLYFIIHIKKKKIRVESTSGIFWYLRTRIKKSLRKMRRNERIRVTTEVQTAQLTNSPHSTVVGKHPSSMSSWLYTHT